MAQGAYSSRLFGAGPEEFKLVFLASILAASAAGTGCYLLQPNLSRGFLLLIFFLGIPLLLLERYTIRQLLHHARSNGHLLHRVVAVGAPAAGNELVDVLHRERYVGYQVVGACIPDGIVVDPESLNVAVLGSVDKTRSVCDALGADTVLVAGGGYSSSTDLRRIGWALAGSDIDLVVVPSLTDVAGPRISMRPVAGLPLVHVEAPQADEAGGFLKRIFDIVVAGLAVVLLSPLMLTVMALIKLEDDPRVTRVGRFIRKYSIEELPQLLNVMRGEISLVGPRPPLAVEVEGYGVDVHRRLLVRPGMTGLWQVSGRSVLTWKESVRLDLYYVDNWSMMGDLVIMSKTVKAVVASQGAY